MSAFLDSFKKDIEKAGFDVGSSEPPRYWFSTGNYVLNRILSGSFLNGIPQGRVTCFTGPSGAGKSFLVCNAIREAQKQGAEIVVLDSEQALDDDFVAKIGVKPDDGYAYVDVSTIPQTQSVVSKVLGGYKEAYGEGNDGPRLLIVIDSLDMLMTETEDENFDKGVTKGDQGQRNKQLKAMLRSFVQKIRHLNISILVTAQVYKNQDVMNGEGVWIVSDAIKFSLSHIAMLTKLKLRNAEDKQIVEGIKLKAEGYKTRFTKPFQTVTLEVPYETGMDPFNGLLEVAIEMGVVERNGKMYGIVGNEETFLKVDFGPHAGDVLAKCEAARDKFLDALIEDTELEVSTQTSAKKRRQEKAEKAKTGT